MTKTDSSILRPGQKDNLPTAGLIFRVQNQVMNARPEIIYSALGFLHDLRGDRLATSDEYQTLLNDASHARELLYHLAGEAGSVELLYGFFSGRNVETDSPSDLANEYPEPPDVDDSVRFCPECETPNQFGEVCNRCRREIQEEGRTDLEVD